MQELLSRAAKGDKDAEEEFFRILLVRFTALAKLTTMEESAEDLAQEACLTVLQKYKTLPDHENFMAWAYGVLRNKIGNYLSRNKRRRQLMADTGTGLDNTTVAQSRHDPALEQEIIDCLQALRRNNARYLRILNLLHLGYETEEICAKVKITRNHLYVLLNRARAALARCLEGDRV